MDEPASPQANHQEKTADAKYPEAAPAARRRRSSKHSKHSKRRRRLETVAVAIAGLTALGIIAGVLIAWSQHETEPTGQVMAVVNGREVTLQDIQAEARASKVAVSNANSTALLAAVVNRTLLAQEARERRLDQTASYPSDKIRAEQVLLADQVAVRELRAASPISDQEAAAYAKAHPYLFAERQDLTLTQLSFEATEAEMKQLGETPTVAALVRGLKQLDKPFVQNVRTVSTADMAPSLVASLFRLPLDGIVLARQGAKVVATALDAADPMPVSNQEALPVARERLQRERAAAQMAGKIDRLRRGAKITYRKDLGAP